MSRTIPFISCMPHKTIQHIKNYDQKQYNHTVENLPEFMHTAAIKFAVPQGRNPYVLWAGYRT